MEFFVELYDHTAPGRPRLGGDDTQTLVTILDEDFPGNLGFESTEIKTSKSQDKVDITIVRTGGTDGKVSCLLKTEKFYDDEATEGATN